MARSGMINNPLSGKSNSWKPRGFDKPTARRLLNTGRVVSSARLPKSGINMTQKSALEFMDQINYINANQNPVFNSIAFDTEFLNIGSNKVPLQIGIAATQVDYTQRAISSVHALTNQQIADEARKRIVGETKTALIVTGIDDKTAAHLKEIGEKVASGGSLSADELRNYRYVLTYKDMTVNQTPITGTSYSNYGGILPLNYFESEVNVVNAKDYLSSFNKAVQNLQDAHVQQQATAPMKFMADSVLEHLSGSLNASLPTEFISQTGSVGDISMAGKVLGAKSVRGKYTNEAVARQFGLSGKLFYKDVEAMSRLVNKDAIGHTGEEIFLRYGGASALDYTHMADSDSLHALHSSLGITESAFRLNMSPSTMTLAPGGQYMASRSFDLSSLGDNLVFNQMFTAEGFASYEQGKISEIASQQLSQSSWAVSAGDVITVKEIKESATASGAKTASKWHTQLIIQNNITNEYSVMAFANREALHQFTEAIDIAPKDTLGRVPAKFLDAKFADKLASTRTEYAKFFQGGYSGWSQFDRYFGAFEEVMDQVSKMPLTEQAREIFEDKGKLVAALKSFQQRNPNVGSVSGDIHLREAFISAAQNVEGIKTSKQVEHLLRMSPELAAKREELAKFRDHVSDSMKGLGRKGMSDRKTVAGDMLRFSAQDSKHLFAGKVEDTAARYSINLRKLGLDGRFNMSSEVDLARSIQAYVRNTTQGHSRPPFGTDALIPARYESFVKSISQPGGLLSKEQSAALMEELSGELAGQGRPSYMAGVISSHIYKSLGEGDDLTNNIKRLMATHHVQTRPEVMYAMTAHGAPNFGNILVDRYQTAMHDYAVTGLIRNPVVAEQITDSLGVSDAYTMDILNRISPQAKELSRFGSGQKRSQTVVESMMTQYQKRGIAADLQIEESGEMSIRLAFSGGTGMSRVPQDSMSQVAVMNIPVLDPTNHTLLYNGEPRTNRFSFRYRGGQLTSSTALESYLSDLSDPRTVARVSNYLKQGDISTAQSVFSNIERENILDLVSSQGNFYEAYSQISADNPLQLHMRNKRLDYKRLIRDYVADLKSSDDMARTFSGLDEDRIGALLLRDPSLIRTMMTEGPDAKNRHMAKVALDIRGLFTEKIGEEDTSKLLRFGFIRASQSGENYLQGFGPEAYSITGKTGISSRDAMVQALGSVQLSESDKVLIGNQLIDRSLVVERAARDIGTKDYAFRFGIGTRQAHVALSNSEAAAKIVNKAGAVRGLNVATAYLDDVTMSKIIAANIQEGNTAVMHAMAPSVRDSAATMAAEIYDSFQTANIRSLKGKQAQLQTFIDMMGVRTVDELQEVINSGDASSLTIRSADYITNKHSKMRTLRELGYRGSGDSTLKSFEILSSGGFKATFAEITALNKFADLSGTKGTVSNLMSRPELQRMFEIARKTGAISQQQYELLVRSDLFMQAEKKTAAALTETILGQFAKEMNVAGLTVDQKKEAVYKLLQTRGVDPATGKEIGLIGKTEDLMKQISLTNKGDIVLDDLASITTTLPIPTFASAASEVLKGYGIDASFYADGVVAGTSNIGAARMYRYGGITPGRMNLQMYEQLQRSMFRMFGKDKELQEKAERLILRPIEEKFYEAARETAPVYQAVKRDLELLAQGATPDIATDKVIWTTQGIGLDNARSALLAEAPEKAADHPTLGALITKDIARGNREVALGASDEILEGTYYNLGLPIDEATGISDRYWVQLPEPVKIGTGPRARQIDFVPMTFRDLVRDEADMLQPDSIQQQQGRLLQTINEYLSPAMDENLDMATRSARYQKSMHNIIGEMSKEQYNAIMGRKGFIKNRAFSHELSFSNRFVAAPTNFLSSDFLQNVDLDKFLEGQTDAVKDVYRNLQSAGRQVQAVSGQRSDLYLTSSGFKSLLHREAERTRATMSQESIDATLKAYQTSPQVSMLGRDPTKDLGTIGLFNLRVFNEAEEEAMIRAQQLAGETFEDARKRFEDSTRDKIILDPTTALVTKADFDGDTMIIRLLGLANNKSRLVIDQAEQAELRSLQRVYSEYANKVSNKILNQDALVGDLYTSPVWGDSQGLSDIIGMSLVDRSESVAEEVARGLAASGKSYVGPLASTTGDLLERSVLMARGAQQLGDPLGYAIAVKSQAAVETWSSVAQEIGIGAKRVQDALAKNAISEEQASLVFAQISEDMTAISRTNAYREIDQEVSARLLGNLQTIGAVDQEGIFIGRAGIIGDAAAETAMTYDEVLQGITDTVAFQPKGSYYSNRIYSTQADEILDAVNRGLPKEHLSGTTMQSVESILSGQTAASQETLNEELREKYKTFVSGKQVIDSASITGEYAKAQFTGDVLGGAESVFKSPGARKALTGAAIGIGGLMVLGALTAPKIKQTDDRSAVDRSETTEGTYLDPAVFAGAPQGAGPTMGLPPAYVSANDPGHNKVTINLRARNNSGLPDSSVIQYIQSEINTQIPLQFQFNYKSSDTRDHLDKNWLKQQTSNIFRYGYTRG